MHTSRAERCRGHPESYMTSVGWPISNCIGRWPWREIRAGLETTQAALMSGPGEATEQGRGAECDRPLDSDFRGLLTTPLRTAAVSVMAAECNYLVTLGAACTLEQQHVSGSVRATPVGQRLGANAWGTSLIVNDGTTFPLCMQHQVTNLVPTPPNGPPFLSGAAVEGPNSASAKGTLSGMVACPPNGVDVFAPFNGKAVYKDFVQSYSTVEPAIDLTASSFLAFSWQMAGAPSGTP